jgi:hypothetical protein
MTFSVGPTASRIFLAPFRSLPLFFNLAMSVLTKLALRTQQPGAGSSRGVVRLMVRERGIHGPYSLPITPTDSLSTIRRCHHTYFLCRYRSIHLQCTAALSPALPLMTQVGFVCHSRPPPPSLPFDTDIFPFSSPTALPTSHIAATLKRVSNFALQLLTATAIASFSVTLAIFSLCYHSPTLMLSMQPQSNPCYSELTGLEGVCYDRFGLSHACPTRIIISLATEYDPDAFTLAMIRNSDTDP